MCVCTEGRGGLLLWLRDYAARPHSKAPHPTPLLDAFCWLRVAKLDYIERKKSGKSVDFSFGNPMKR